MFVMIETNGRITPAQIVRLTQFDKGLVSRTIKGMQKKGLLTVEISDKDGRSHIIDMTQKGRDIAERARPAMRARQEMFRQSLTPDELESLFRLFDKLDIALDEMEKSL